MPDAAPLTATATPAHRCDLPPVEIDPQEDRLGEEGEPFERERHADDGPGEFHEMGPQESELERENRPRDSADREQDRGSLGPPLGQLQVDLVARLLPPPLGDDHEDGHSDADDSEDDVEGKGDRHLGAGREEVGHGRKLLPA
jgi:hypothetical protein